MFLASCVIYATLACGEPGGATLVRLPPTEEPSLATFVDDTSAFPSPIEQDDPLPGNAVKFTWLASGGSNGFGTFDVDANHTWLLGYDESPPLNITPGLGLHFWSGPADLDLPPRVYDLYLDLQWEPLVGENWGLALGLTPGLYGDGERLDGDTFQLTGWSLAHYRLNEHWNVMAGVAYVRQLRSHLLPVGGVVWTPHDDTRLELLFPNPKFARRLFVAEEGSTWWTVSGQLGGGAWAVADTPDSNVLVSYSDLRLLAGIQQYHWRGREWSVEAGYVFARDLSVDEFVVHSPSNTFLLQGSLAY